MAHFCLQCLLLILLMVISECRDPSPEIALAARGENVVLPCFNSTVMDQKSCYRVKLFVTDDKQKVLFARPKSPKIPDDKRIKWQADENGQMSLYLTKLQESDERRYTCEICKGWDCTLVKTISVKIKECTLAAPMKAAPNTSIHLTCPVDIKPGQQRPSKISWVMRKGDESVDVNSEAVKINETLAIQSVNKTDNGWYRCNYTLGQSQRCFDMNLLVQDEVNNSTIQAPTTNVIISPTGKDSSIVAVVSVVFVIALMAALIGLLIYCRRNTRRNPLQTQRHSAVSFDGYEVVSLAVPEDSTNHRVNSFYQPTQDSSLCTFQY